MLLYIFLIKSTTMGATMKEDFLKLYILDPRGHTLVINLGFVCAVGAGEQEADTRRKSWVTAPTLMSQGFIHIYS